MDTLSDMRSAIQSDLNVSTNSSLFPPATIDSKINRAYIKIANYVRWDDLEDAKTTSTQASQEYYDVPDTWQYNSAWRLMVNDVIYGEKPDGSPLAFKDYLEWKEDNENSTLKKWSMYRNQIFIYPTPSTAGIEIVAWGLRNISTLSSDSDQTIFSENSPLLNEAIVLEATAMLQRKGEKDDQGEFVSTEAQRIVLVASNRQKRENAKFEKAQPVLNVPDFFGNQTSEDTIGNFVDNN